MERVVLVSCKSLAIKPDESQTSWDFVRMIEGHRAMTLGMLFRRFQRPSSPKSPVATRPDRVPLYTSTTDSLGTH